MKSHRIAFGMLFLHFLVFLMINQLVNPHPDMLDHWVWSRFLSGSYYEHPPMIALAIRLITLIAGHSETALEIGAQFYNLFILLLTYLISYQLFGKKSAELTLGLLCMTTYFTIGSIFLHIDQPFLIFWLLSLYSLCRFQQTQSAKWLITIGILAGLGALSKYIMILFYIGLGTHCLLYSEARRLLWNPWLYVAGAISLLIFSPVLIWNYQNNWVSFLFQFKRGLSGAGFGENVLNFTVGHLLLFSPIWSFWCLRNIYVDRNQYKYYPSIETILLVTALVPLGFFTLMSLRGSIADPHWANVSYLGLMILGGKKLSTLYKKMRYRYLMGTGFLINLAIIGVCIYHIHSPIIDFMEFKLENYEYLEHQGVPLNTRRDLQNVNKRYFKVETYTNSLKRYLSDDDFNRYSPIIFDASRRTLADYMNPMMGWKETSIQLQELLKQKKIKLPDFVITKEFQLGGALSFHLSNHPWPHSLEKPERNQWSPKNKVSQSNAILVCDLPKCPAAVEHYYKIFQSPLQFIGTVKTEGNNRVVRMLGVYNIFR